MTGANVGPFAEISFAENDGPSVPQFSGNSRVLRWLRANQGQ